MPDETGLVGSFEVVGMRSSLLGMHFKDSDPVGSSLPVEKYHNGNPQQGESEIRERDVARYAVMCAEPGHDDQQDAPDNREGKRRVAALGSQHH